MATTPPMIGGSDPSVLRSLETPTPSVARTSPPTVSATTGSATSGGTAVARGIAPQVSGATTTYNQATQTASGTSLTITSATSNDPADVVTVYNTNKAISVSAVNQTVNSYKVNNYAGNEYSNNDVANYLPTFTGNVGAGNVNVTGGTYTYELSATGLASLTTVNVSATTNLGAVGNVTITGGSNGQVLTTNGSNVLSWTTVSGGGGNSSQISNGNSNVTIPISNDNVYITTNDGNSKQWIFNKDGSLRIPGNIDIVGGINFPQQVSSLNWSTYNIELSQYGRINTNVDFFANANTIGALYLKGDGSNISNIAGANISGFAPNANVANTAFAVAAANVSGLGNIATINLTGSTSNVLYGNGVFAAVAGGNANTGNVTFDDVTVQGVNQLNLSWDPLATANLAYLQVRGGDVASHIHLDTGNNEAYDLIVGNDNKFVQVSSTGNIIMSSYDGNTSYTWTLDTTGNLILAGGDSVIQSIANSSLDPNNANVSTMVFTPDQNYTSQSLVIDPTGPSHIHLRAPGANIDEPDANIFLGGEASSFEVGYYNGSAPNLYIHSNNNTWTFDTTGNLIIPGGLVGSGASPAPYISGFASASFSGNLSSGNLDVSSTALIGPNTSANFTRFPNAQVVISNVASGIQQNEPGNIGLISETTASSANTAIRGVGVYGVGYTSGGASADGVDGEGHVSDTNDTGTATGVRGYSLDAHVGGVNIGVYASALNGATNYALYMKHGNIISDDPQTWTLADNNASALSLNATGKTGILNIVTTNGSEGVTMSGYANVTGNVIAGNLMGPLANGNSNVSVATANGNVTINAVGNTTMTVTGTGANVTGTLTSTGKIGYASGSTVTQTSNRGNGVNINALAGTIVTVSASMTAGEIGAFSVTNNQVDTNNDIVLVQVVSPNLGNYNVIANPNSGIGGFYLTLQNISGFPISAEAVTIRFMVIKAPNA